MAQGFVLVVNLVFLASIIAVLAGVSLLVFALAWYNLGPMMADPTQWTRSHCHIEQSRVSPQNSNPYSSGHRYRAEFAVSFKLPHNATFLSAAALVHLQDTWGSHEKAEADLARYPRGNTTSCFCPTHDINVWTAPERWSIYRFCLLRFTPSEARQLLSAYHLWLELGIVSVVLGGIGMAVGMFAYVRTRCFRRRMRWGWRRRYEVVN